MFVNSLIANDVQILVETKTFSGTAIASIRIALAFVSPGIMEKRGLCVQSRTFDNHLGTIF
jgi:hypothetical protein